MPIHKLQMCWFEPTNFVTCNFAVLTNVRCAPCAYSFRAPVVLMFGLPTTSLLGTGVRWVLTGTHCCVMMSRVTSSGRQLAAVLLCCCAVAVVDLLWCVALVRCSSEVDLCVSINTPLRSRLCLASDDRLWMTTLQF